MTFKEFLKENIQVIIIYICLHIPLAIFSCFTDDIWFNLIIIFAYEVWLVSWFIMIINNRLNLERKTDKQIYDLTIQIENLKKIKES
jgi:hypothetical protein